MLIKCCTCNDMQVCHSPECELKCMCVFSLRCRYSREWANRGFADAKSDVCRTLGWLFIVRLAGVGMLVGRGPQKFNGLLDPTKWHLECPWSKLRGRILWPQPPLATTSGGWCDALLHAYASLIFWSWIMFHMKCMLVFCRDMVWVSLCGCSWLFGRTLTFMCLSPCCDSHNGRVHQQGMLRISCTPRVASNCVPWTRSSHDLLTSCTIWLYLTICLSRTYPWDRRCGGWEPASMCETGLSLTHGNWWYSKLSGSFCIVVSFPCMWWWTMTNLKSCYTHNNNTHSSEFEVQHGKHYC